MGSFLVVANQTLGGDALTTHLRHLIEADPGARFVVVVPVSTSMPVDLGGMGVMSGLPVIEPVTQDHFVGAASDRLNVLMSMFHDLGVEAEGTIVGDPMAAMEAATASHTFDEIIISTLPAPVSKWLRLDLVHRASRRFDVPITTVTAADETPPSAARVDAATAEAATSSIQATSPRKRVVMAESVYKIIELVGTSPESWEKAASAAVTTASQTLRDLRVAEVSQLDMVIDDGVVSAYRAKVKVSFKYEGHD